MNIVLEGFDGSGKSTLAAFLAKHLSRRIIHSDGPEQYPGELDERAHAFLAQDGVICDRHPCVSEDIYCVLRGGESRINRSLVEKFYATEPLLIYCPGIAGEHIVREGEDPAHIKALTTNRTILLQRYDAWGLKHAQLLYRYADDPFRLLQACIGIVDRIKPFKEGPWT